MCEFDQSRYEALKPGAREYLQFAADFGKAVAARRPCNAEALGMAASALTQLGYYQEGLAYDQRLFALRPRDPVVIYNLACSLALVGDDDAAFSRLEDAIRLGYRDAASIAADADWAKVRDDPRFKELLRFAKDSGKEAGCEP